MKNKTIANFKYWLLALPALAFIFSCNYSKPQLTPDEIGRVQHSVNKLTKDLTLDIMLKGPTAWLNYIQDTANFFMATDGQLAFKDHKSAVRFIQDSLEKNVSQIILSWKNMRIDPLTNSIASVGSDYSEAITDKSGKTDYYNGYFTATVVQVDEGWKFRNMHWSDKPAKK